MKSKIEDIFNNISEIVKVAGKTWQSIEDEHTPASAPVIEIKDNSYVIFHPAINPINIKISTCAEYVDVSGNLGYMEITDEGIDKNIKIEFNYKLPNLTDKTPTIVKKQKVITIGF